MAKKYTSVRAALDAQAEARRYLHPIQLLQEAVYGESFMDDPDKSTLGLSTDEGKLSEHVCATVYQGEIDLQAGHDVLTKRGVTIESKFRRLSVDSSSPSAYTATITGLDQKDADFLFILIYNPVTETLDAFEYTREQYRLSDALAIRWSGRIKDYTPRGGGDNRKIILSSREIFESSKFRSLTDADLERELERLTEERLKREGRKMATQVISSVVARDVLSSAGLLPSV